MAYNFGNGQLSVTIKHFLCFFYLQRYGSTDLNKFLSIKIKTKQQQQQKKNSYISVKFSQDSCCKKVITIITILVQ